MNETSPAFLKVTTPVYSLIVAIDSSDEDHLTDLFVASEAEIFAVSTSGTPTTSWFVLLVTSIDSAFFSVIELSLTTTILVIYVCAFAVITTFVAAASYTI